MESFPFGLYPKQLIALKSPARFVAYGGALGGGKSYSVRVIAIQAALAIPNIQIYLFRRNFEELIDNHMKGPMSFPEMLAPMQEEIGTTGTKNIRIIEKDIIFPNYSQIHFCHCENEKDVWKYSSLEMHLLMLEQGEQFYESQIRLLLSRNRVPMGLQIPAHERIRYPRAFATLNPEGESFHFWKNLFVKPFERLKTKAVPYPIWMMDKDEGHRSAQFIPAFVDDNPSINPEEYKASLMSLKRKDLIDGLLYGKWDIPRGAFFPELDDRRHQLKNFPMPTWWFKFRTFDWGSGAPFACLWFAVADNSFQWIPEGSLVCYREWYGASPFDMTKGLGMSNEQVALGILDRSPPREMIMGTITDSKPFQAGGGVTIAEEFKRFGVPLQLGDVRPGSRIQGWQQLRSRLIGSNGQPKIFFLDNCPETWRTLQTLQTSTNPAHKGEDCVSTGEDHIPDAVSLACKARPLVKKLPPAPVTEVKPDRVSFEDMIDYTREQRRRDESRIR